MNISIDDDCRANQKKSVLKVKLFESIHLPLTLHHLKVLKTFWFEHTSFY